MVIASKHLFYVLTSTVKNVKMRNIYIARQFLFMEFLPSLIAELKNKKILSSICSMLKIYSSANYKGWDKVLLKWTVLKISTKLKEKSLIKFTIKKKLTFSKGVNQKSFGKNWKSSKNKSTKIFNELLDKYTKTFEKFFEDVTKLKL